MVSFIIFSSVPWTVQKQINNKQNNNNSNHIIINDSKTYRYCIYNATKLYIFIFFSSDSAIFVKTHMNVFAKVKFLFSLIQQNHI